MSGIRRLEQFADPACMAVAVTVRLAADLSAAIERQGRAVFAAAGGRTPIEVYRQLSEATLAWEQVLITPTDERCVPADSPDSNAKMLRSYLLQARAASAGFHSAPEFTSLDARTGRPLFNVKAALPMPLDVVLLGMGEDGHVASLFPGSEVLSNTSQDWPWIGVPAGGPGAPPPQPRISLALDALVSARRLHLIASGRRKRELIDKALEGSPPSNPLPIHLIVAMRRQLDIYWSP